MIRLGGVLAALDTLGPAPRSNWTGAPSDGVDLATRFAEDLALLGTLGVTDVRLGLDWARLAPAPGRIDDDWREWYEDVLSAASSAGIGVWATLHEMTVPAWFDDEGSFADARTAGKWWPRWVEAAADMFGDRVAGWFPMHDPVGVAARWSADQTKHQDATINVAVAWRDAWRVLRGGPPVSTSLGVWMVRPHDRTVPAATAARLEDHLRWKMWLRALRDGVVHLPNGNERVIADLGGATDRLGLSTALDLSEGRVTDDSLHHWEERFGSVLRRAAEEGPNRPIIVSGLRIEWAQEDERRLLVEAAVNAARAAERDGVALEALFVDPAIGRHPDAAALVTRDRDQSRESDGWLGLTRPAE